MGDTLGDRVALRARSAAKLVTGFLDERATAVPEVPLGLGVLGRRIPALPLLSILRARTMTAAMFDAGADQATSAGDCLT
jgi:hypothetical protein